MDTGRACATPHTVTQALNRTRDLRAVQQLPCAPLRLEIRLENKQEQGFVLTTSYEFDRLYFPN